VTGHGLPTPAPTVSPEARPYWDATAEGRLLLPRCEECSALIWYPRGFCPACSTSRIAWVEASGRGTVYSYTVLHRGAMGPYRGAEPYVLAYVELEEGPRVLTNLVDCDPQAIAIGDPVQAVFAETGAGPSLVRFSPR
jgi:uncharacterized OB-fold protein